VGITNLIAKTRDRQPAATQLDDLLSLRRAVAMQQEVHQPPYL
jgi:hypothetical protein